MNCADFIKINSKSMELMSKYGIRQEDYRFVDMYEEYAHMRRDGEKYAYIVAVLSKKYGISESSVKRLIRRLSYEVKI